MLDERHLILGLDALSRAHTTNYFVDGHKGAAILSAYYLCREHEVESGAAQTIADLIEKHWSHTDLCAPFPEETADEALLDQIVTALESNIGRFRQVGHNVIFPSLALRAFHEVPNAVTPSRVKGLCRLIESFETAEDLTLEPGDEDLQFDDPQPMAEFILAEFLRTMDTFLGRGQGWSGHLLTYGLALIDLHRLGYTDLARSGQYAFSLYVKRTRMGPGDRDREIPEHGPSALRPLQAAYWDRRKEQDPTLGHCFKYPYGFHGLLSLSKDVDLRERCVEEAFRIF